MRHRDHRHPVLPSLVALVAAVAAWTATDAAIARQAPVLPDEVPEELEGVGVTDHTGDPIPLDIALVDEDGEPVTLQQYFDRGQPVMLTLNYYRCPMLCIETLNGLVDALMEVDWQAGRDFQFVTVSFDPNEGPDLAAAKKANYLNRYTKPGADEGWHFLTGEQDQIDRLLEATGFRVRFDPRSGEWAHSSSVIFLTPEGTISLYMNDVLFRPSDLRLAIVEASQGKIGSPIDQFLLFTCFQYDPDAGSYTASVMKLMRTAGLVTVTGLAAILLVLWRRGSRRQGGGQNASTTTDPDRDGLPPGTAAAGSAR